MYDQEANRRCGRWLVVVETDDERRAYPLRCRRWACPRCGPAMRRRLVHLVGQTHPTSFLTLTCDPSKHRDPFAAALAMSKALPRLVQRMRRFSKGQPVEYLAIWEKTKAGWPHLHILLVAPFIPHRLLSAWWQVLSGAPIVYIEAVDDVAGAARYVAKYLTKAADAHFPGRLWRASAGFLPEPFRPTQTRPIRLGNVYIYRDSLADLLLEWWGSRLIIEAADESGARARPWSAKPADESLEWLRWERSRSLVDRLRGPPTLASGAKELPAYLPA